MKSGPAASRITLLKDGKTENDSFTLSNPLFSPTIAIAVAVAIAIAIAIAIAVAVRR